MQRASILSWRMAAISGMPALIAARNQLLKLASQDPQLVAVRPNGLEDAPQVMLDIDREKANAMGVSIADINTTVQGFIGSLYVNEFTRNGRPKRVFIPGRGGVPGADDGSEQVVRAKQRGPDGAAVEFRARHMAHRTAK